MSNEGIRIRLDSQDLILGGTRRCKGCLVWDGHGHFENEKTEAEIVAINPFDVIVEPEKSSALARAKNVATSLVPEKSGNETILPH